MALQNAFGNLALDATLASTNTKLDSILTELNQKLEAGQQVALDAATLAALETITVANTDFPDAAVLAKLEAIRVLLAAPIAATQSGTWTVQPGNTPNTTPWLIFPPDTTTAGQSGQTALGNNVLNAVAGTGAIDLQSATMGHIKSIYIQFIVSGTITAGTLIFEGSNDNFATTAVTISLMDDALNNGTSSVNFNLVTATNRFWSGPTKYRYFRVRISTGVTGAGGSVQAIAKYSVAPYVNTTTLVNQPSTSTFQVVSNLNSIAGTGTAVNTGAVSAGTQRNVLTNDYLSTTLNKAQAGTTNGTTTSTVNSAATTNEANLKASAGSIYSITAINTTATTKYVRFYNKATTPVVGTDVAIIVVAIPATNSKEITFPIGVIFGTGIGYSITGLPAVNDATATAVGDVQLLVSWI